MALAIGIVVAYRAGARRAARGSNAAELRREHPPAVELDTSQPPTHDSGPPTHDPALVQLLELAEERHALFGALADARAEIARYRQIVVDIERNAPPPLLDAPNTPDDLKLIVGVGPVIERMLYQLGVATYRQIAQWSERDIDEFDAHLAEFPGRIRRDEWVTQARALHASKYGSPP